MVSWGSAQENLGSNLQNFNLSEIKEIKIDGAYGKLDTRLYVPKGAGPITVVLYFHRGGWVIANNNVYDATPR